MPNITEDKILGPEAPLWSETHRGGDQNEFLIFPRAISHAEVGWTPQAQRNVRDYLERMSGIGARLAILDSNFYDGNKVTWGSEVAGLVTETGVGNALRVDVVQLAAPGTKASADGTSIAVDTVNDADGTSRSVLAEPLSATIDFGDGSAPVTGTFLTDAPRTPVAAAGLYRIGAVHSYAAAGSYDVTVTLSNGEVLEATVTDSESHEAPALPEVDLCVAPTMTLAATTTRDDARLGVTLTGLEPSSYVDVIWDGAKYGTVRTDAEGNAFVSHYTPYQTVEGEHMLRVQDSLGRFVEQVIDVDSMTQAPEGRQITGITATASSQALNETAPDGRAASLVDGDVNTFWHSLWAAPAATYPHWMAFDLGEAHELNTIVIVPRQDSANGRFKTFDIEVSDDGETWSAYESGVAIASGGASAFAADVDVTARHVRITATAPHTASHGFATADEIEFWGLLPGETLPEVQPLVPEVWAPGDGCEPTVDPEPSTTPDSEPEPTTTVTVTQTPEVTVTPTTTVTPTSTVTVTPTTTVTITEPGATTTTTVTATGGPEPTQKPFDVYTTPGAMTTTAVSGSPSASPTRKRSAAAPRSGPPRSTSKTAATCRRPGGSSPTSIR